MQVDFYHLSQTTVEAALPRLAQRTLEAGERLLVVAEQTELHVRLSEGLWALTESFLAHDIAGSPHEGRQPILLSDTMTPTNGARFVALADGRWREEALGFERAMLLFDGSTVEDARGLWRTLDGRDGVSRRYFAQEGGKWVHKA
jgi:DNA polymerase-3 subunit chi